MALTEQQREARLAGLGGSDMAAVVSWYSGMPELSPWKQAQELWLEKTGQLYKNDELDDEEVNQLYFGNILEEPIAKAYAKRTGQKVRRVNSTLQSEEFPFLIAHIDRRIEGQPDGGLEIKNVGGFAGKAWGKDMTDEVAPYYLPQVHHYMLVRDAAWWDVVAYFGGGDLRIYRVERSQAWSELIAKSGAAFWKLVQDKTAPGWDWSHPSTSDLLKTIYGVETGKQIEMDLDAFHWHKVLQEAKQKAKEYDAVVECARNHLMNLMGDAALALLPDGTGYKRTKVNLKACVINRAASSHIRMTYTKSPKRS